MIPPLDYRAELLAFDSGSCLSCDDAVVLYGPAPYHRAEFDASLAGFRPAGRVDRAGAMGGGPAASRAILQGDLGRVAMIVVTDSENVLHGRAVRTAQKLKGVLGDRLCTYPIQVDRDRAGRRVMDALANLGGCGFAVNADDISSPNAMAEYVSRVFLASAAAPVAAAPVYGAPDSDGDGVPDSRDKCPNTPGGVRVTAEGCWELRGIYFDSDRAVIKDTNVLDEAVVILNANPKLTGEVQGHTDSTASAEHNRRLSEARARAVRDYFIRQGVAPERIEVKGHGETRPVASNDTAEGRARNRRVELHPDNGE
jgi:OOP family OmpA-OmpF porin